MAVVSMTLTQRDAAEELGVSYSYFKEHVLRELKVIRRGRRTLIPRTELERWVEESATAT